MVSLKLICYCLHTYIDQTLKRFFTGNVKSDVRQGSTSTSTYNPRWKLQKLHADNGVEISKKYVRVVYGWSSSNTSGKHNALRLWSHHAAVCCGWCVKFWHFDRFAGCYRWAARWRFTGHVGWGLQTYVANGSQCCIPYRNASRVGTGWINFQCWKSTHV